MCNWVCICVSVVLLHAETAVHQSEALQSSVLLLNTLIINLHIVTNTTLVIDVVIAMTAFFGSELCISNSLPCLRQRLGRLIRLLVPLFGFPSVFRKIAGTW